MSEKKFEVYDLKVNQITEALGTGCRKTGIFLEIKS